MPVYKCSECIPTIVPDVMTEEQKDIVVSLARTSGRIFAIRRIRDLLGTPLIEAKNIGMHITLREGKCHKCQTDLIAYEGNCPKCKRLNLDW